VVQKTKEVVVFQVYMLLMHLYFGVLDDSTQLQLYNPSLHLTKYFQRLPLPADVNPLDKLKPIGVLPANNAPDPQSSNVRKLSKPPCLTDFINVTTQEQHVGVREQRYH
jgi:hypothetical protein